jgi:hypothetical protein
MSESKEENSKITEFIHKYGINTNYTTILGPSGVILNKIGSKYILYFQDFHVEPKPECNTPTQSVWIDDFLKELFEVTPSCIDFFLESSLFQVKMAQENIIKLREEKSSKYSKRGITRLEFEFLDCIGPYKLGCDKYNTRFHDINFRDFDRNIYNINISGGSVFQLPLYYMALPSDNQCRYRTDEGVEIKECVFPFDVNYTRRLTSTVNGPYTNVSSFNPDRYDNVMKNYIRESKRIYLNFLEGILDNDMKKVSDAANALLDLFPNINIDSRVRDSFTVKRLGEVSLYSRLNKQISSLPPNVQVTIRRLIIKYYKDDVEPLLDFVIDNLENSVMEYKDVQDYVYYSIVNFGSVIVDAYALARVLKAVYNYENELIVIYAGVAHIEFYIKVLEKFKQVEEIASIACVRNCKEKKACINILQGREEWNKIMEVIEATFSEERRCKFHPSLQRLYKYY